MRSTKLRDLGRLAAWPLGRLAGLLLLNLLLLGVLAMLWKCCTPPPVVGDFPIVERSSRGPIPVSLPLPSVVGLVVPSAQVRRPAMQAKHRGQSRGLRRYRVPAWFPARRFPRRYGLPRQRRQVSARIVRALGGPPAIERQPPEQGAYQWVVSARTQAQNPGTRETTRARRKLARRHQCEEGAVLAPTLRGLSEKPVPVDCD